MKVIIVACWTTGSYRHANFQQVIKSGVGAKMVKLKKVKGRLKKNSR